MEMIKEIAFGVSNRGNFQSKDEVWELEGTDTDLFVSLYDYDETVVAYYSKKGSLSGFDGDIFMPTEFILDVDGSSIRDARDKLIGLSNVLDDCNLYYRVYFSGTGFHVGIHKSAFKWEPSPNLHVRVKEELTKAGIYEFADPSVTDKTRIIRLLNTKNTKSGLYKVCIEDNLQILSSSDKIFKEELIKLASEPRNIEYEDIEMNAPIFDVTDKEKPKVKVRSTRDPITTTCIQKMLDGAPHGKRHMVALRIASHLRWNFPENIVRLIMEDWRVKVSQDAQSEFKKEEMDGIVEGCYTGHDGQGYRYGADDPVIKFYCDSKCTLHS